MHVSTLQVSRRLWLLLLGTLVFFSLPALAQAPARTGYAILIVGDEGDAEMLRVEKILINEIAKRIRSDGLAEKLPLQTYHFNKERERAYCENKLNILAEDLLFVGVVAVENKIPMKVVYRIDRIVNAPRAGKDAIERFKDLAEIAEPAVTPPVTSPETPPGNPAANPAASPEAGEEGFRVQLGSFTMKNFADERKATAEKSGFEVEIVEATGPDGDVLYKVLSPAFRERADADAHLAKFKAAGFDQVFLVRLTTR